MEVQAHGLEEQERVMAETLRIAKSIGAPVVGTNDSHYLEAGHARAHEALLCIQTGTNLQDTEPLPVLDRRSSTSSPPRRWRASSRISRRPAGTRWRWPSAATSRSTSTSSTCRGTSCRASTRSTAICTSSPTRASGAGTARARATPSRRGCAHELAVIEKMGFAGYFLVVWDFIRYAREQGIAVGPGRGSSAGSLTAYCLGITNIDPMRYGLLFERFLNPERISMPDMDIDFSDDRRDEVIRYVAERYGRDRVAHIITFGTLGAKAAIRDVGRVLGMPYGDVDRIAKLVPNFPLNITLDDAHQKSLPLAEMVRSQANVRELWDIARALEGCTRHASVHASAVVISDEPLEEYIPLYKDPKRPELITGYAMGPIEKLGLLKMDFLGLRTLTVLANTVALIKESRGLEHRFRRVCRSTTRRPTRCSPRRRRSACSSWSRPACAMRCAVSSPSSSKTSSPWSRSTDPGPMELIPDFIQRKHGRSKITYEHPAMEKFTRETYGIMVYQEQIMQIASEMAGFTMGEADILRRAMGKKDRELMAKQREKFITGCRERNTAAREGRARLGADGEVRGLRVQQVPRRGVRARRVSDGVLQGELSGRVHGRAADLRDGRHRQDREVHRGVSGDGDPRRAARRERLGRAVQRGRRHGALRPGRDQERRRGGDAVDLEDPAAARGPFATLEDFCARVDLRLVNRRVVESLIKAGAFDSLGLTRAHLLATTDAALESGQRQQRDRAEGQASFFELMPAAAPARASAPIEITPEWEADQRLAFEKEVLGFYISGHPLARYRSVVEPLGITTSAGSGRQEPRLARPPLRSRERTQGDLDEGRQPHGVLHARGHGRHRRGHGVPGAVQVGGSVPSLGRGRARCAAGSTTATRGGSCSPRTFACWSRRWRTPSGRARNGGGASEPNACRIRVTPGEDPSVALAAVRQLCGEHPGRVPVFLHLVLGAQEVVVRTRGLSVDGSRELVAEGDAVLGPGAVSVDYAGRA